MSTASPSVVNVDEVEETGETSGREGEPETPRIFALAAALLAGDRAPQR